MVSRKHPQVAYNQELDGITFGPRKYYSERE